MFKVLVWGMTFNPGGVESVIMNYYRNISKEVCQFTFLGHTDEIAYKDEILARGDKIISIPTRRQNIVKFYKGLNKVFKECTYDAVWANVCSLSNIALLKVAKKYGVKIRIIHSHNSKNMGSFKSAILHNINKQFIHKYATKFWACGQLAGEYFYKDKILKSDKYEIIPNAINLDRFKFDEAIRNRYRIDMGIDDKLVFGHIGRYHFQKNQQFLLNVFYEIQKQRKDAILLLVGQGEDEQKLKQQAIDLGIEDNVRFLGLRKDVESLLLAFDLMIFPSLFEGLSVALLEAQATGLPIYAADTIAKQTKVNNNFKFLSLQSSPSEWATSILSDIAQLSRDASAHQNLKIQGFDINDQVQNFVELLKLNTKED